MSFGFISTVEMVRIGLWATCDSLEKSFGVGEENQAMMVGIIHFLLSIKLADIVNEIGMAVISREGFRYSALCPVIIPPLWKERSSRDP